MWAYVFYMGYHLDHPPIASIHIPLLPTPPPRLLDTTDDWMDVPSDLEMAGGSLGARLNTCLPTILLASCFGGTSKKIANDSSTDPKHDAPFAWFFHARGTQVTAPLVDLSRISGFGERKTVLSTHQVKKLKYTNMEVDGKAHMVSRGKSSELKRGHAIHFQH